MSWYNMIVHGTRRTLDRAGVPWGGRGICSYPRLPKDSPHAEETAVVFNASMFRTLSKMSCHVL